MDINKFKEELSSANVEYACNSAYIIVMNTESGGFGTDRFLISDDGMEHCGYLVVKGCSIGIFWFDLYNGTWESGDEEAKLYLQNKEIIEFLNKRFADVAVCLGPSAHGINEKEVWRKIIALHYYGDMSKSNEIDVMGQSENAQLIEAARYPSSALVWNVKRLSDCL